MDTSLMFSSKTDKWATPQDFFDEINREFGFSLDVCALPENAKTTRYYTPEQDGLTQPWEGGGMVQSSIWPSNRQMGGEGGLGGKVWRGGSDAAARTDGHQVVPRVHIWQG